MELMFAYVFSFSHFLWLKDSFEAHVLLKGANFLNPISGKFKATQPLSWEILGGWFLSLAKQERKLFG